jgi:hypothetical protein
LHHVGSYRDDGATAYLRYDVLHDVEPLIGRAAELVGSDEPVLVNCRAEQAFRFYARGRLGRATVCDLYQQRGNEELLVRQWLDGVDHRGWILQTKDDIRGSRFRSQRRGLRDPGCGGSAGYDALGAHPVEGAGCASRAVAMREKEM